MNMRALVLHVLGDALGNVGVYFDPAISLVIACIILGSAVPLVRSASFVLLQGVPATISLEQVRAAILAVEGLHIWQLSESKNIASVHVLAARELDFMPIAAQIRRALHDQGIHSWRMAAGVERTRACLVLCPPEECDPRDNACCPPGSTDV
ncbi:cation efflux family-domain-containing protein [Mycena alexandri]|uniref:Cation efflux family-domain-containing protein n=1 Tax=Mycena alexandri TaxID=1745969 RepID=A0AAD6WJW2_9AGAR|nr:cation efflux family-domain-containing protein [Mycena alexandri]